MRTVQMDDDLDTPIQQLIKAVSTHTKLILKLESASDRFLQEYRLKRITLRAYYLKVIFS